MPARLPQIPADLSSIGEADLSALLVQLRAFFAENREGATTPELVAELRHAADGARAIDTELSGRAERVAADLAEVDAAFADPAGGGESEDGGAAGAAGVAASGGQPSLEDMARHRIPAQAARPQPAAGVRMLTAAGVTLDGRDAFLRQVADEINAASGDRATVEFTKRLGRIEYDFPAARRLSESDAVENMALIAAAVGADADRHPASLVAASILCAPTAPYYQQAVIAGTERPVRDALIGFGASRGGVRFMPPPVMSDVASGITTVAADPGTTTKPCVNVACPSPSEVQVAAVPFCIEFDNFNARAWPERVEALMSVGAAEHARVAETFLLDGIATASTAVTAAKGYGAGRQLLANLIQAATAYRSRQRMPRDAEIEVLLPSWAPDIMRADLVRSWNDEMTFFALTDTQIAEMFAAAHVRPTYYLDTKTGGSQVFAAQAGGPLTSFPSNMFAYLFAPGSFIHVDGGTLDFGLIRDSTLNAANKYRMMMETFENVAKVGLESIELRATICPDGTYAPAATAITCP